jgi:hypothetical protein
MPTIPVDRVVDKKEELEKKEGRGGGKAQGVSDQKKESFNKTRVLIEQGSTE